MASIGRQTKDALTADIRARVQQSRHLFVTRFKVLSPAASYKLRRQLRGTQATCLVTKRSLLIRALTDSPFQAAGAWADGPTAIILAQDDPVTVSKTLLVFIKDNEAALEIKGAIVEGQALSWAEIASLAKLPSRQQLLTQVATGVQAPISGLVGVLHGLLRQAVSVIAQIQKQMEGKSHG